MSELDEIDHLLRQRGARLRARSAEAGAPATPGHPVADPPAPTGVDPAVGPDPVPPGRTPGRPGYLDGLRALRDREQVGRTEVVVCLDDLRRRGCRQDRRRQIASAAAAVVAVIGAAGMAVAARGGEPEPITAGAGMGIGIGIGSAEGAVGPTAADGGRPQAGPDPTVTRRPRPSSTTTVPDPVRRTTPAGPPGTAAQARPSTTIAAPPATAPDLRSVDYAGSIAFPGLDCPAPASAGAPVRLVVSDVQVGDLLGDPAPDAVVEVACPGATGSQTWLVTGDATQPGQVRAVARVEPGAEALVELQRSVLTSWVLLDVQIAGRRVVSEWRGRGPAAPASSAPTWSVTISQQWATTGWTLSEPVTLAPEPSP